MSYFSMEEIPAYPSLDKLGKVCKYPNLAELVYYHPYNYVTFADHANITNGLMEAVITAGEELTKEELHGMWRLINSDSRHPEIDFSVLVCPKLIMLDNQHIRHCRMIDELSGVFLKVMDYRDSGSREAQKFLDYHTGKCSRIESDFFDRNQVSYCRWLGGKNLSDGRD